MAKSLPQRGADKCQGLEGYDCLGIISQFLGKLLAQANDKYDLPSVNQYQILSTAERELSGKFRSEAKTKPSMTKGRPQA
jgi:hypothetical protein